MTAEQKNKAILEWLAGLGAGVDHDDVQETILRFLLVEIEGELANPSAYLWQVYHNLRREGSRRLSRRRTSSLTEEPVADPLSDELRRWLATEDAAAKVQEMLEVYPGRPAEMTRLYISSGLDYDAAGRQFLTSKGNPSATERDVKKAAHFVRTNVSRFFEQVRAGSRYHWPPIPEEHFKPKILYYRKSEHGEFYITERNQCIDPDYLDEWRVVDGPEGPTLELIDYSKVNVIRGDERHAKVFDLLRTIIFPSDDAIDEILKSSQGIQKTPSSE